MRNLTLGGARTANIDGWRDAVDACADLVSPEEYEAWIKRASGICHPDIEWDQAEVAGPLNIPILLYGLDAVQNFWRGWLKDWIPLGLHYDMVEAGDAAVLLVEKESFRSRRTGMVASIGPYAQVGRFEGGLMVTWKAYASQSRAVEAAQALTP